MTTHFVLPFLTFFWQSFVNLRELNFDGCKCLTEIPDISVLQNLEELSFEDCVNLITVHNSVGLLDKLKTLSANGCRKLKTFPPIKLTSLEKLELSHCSILESFPEILMKMENIRELHLGYSLITELPLSFQNLTGLRTLDMFYLNSAIVKVPSSIIMMPELTDIFVCGLKGLQWLKQEEGEEQMGPVVLPSKVEWLSVLSCNLNDDFFSIDFTRFALVKELALHENNFTILPECLKQCQFLWYLNVSGCKHLQEIRGIPPNLRHFFAKKCISLASSSKRMLLNQVLSCLICT